jgi:hypothetical protein
LTLLPARMLPALKALVSALASMSAQTRAPSLAEWLKRQAQESVLVRERERE